MVVFWLWNNNLAGEKTMTTVPSSVDTRQTMNLQDWAIAHQPDEKMFFKDGYWHQIIFVRDIVPCIFAKTHRGQETVQYGTKVISTHTSKSIRLPVYQVELEDRTTFTMRDNFNDWKVSVSSPREVKADFLDLFDPNMSIDSCYCEGFPENLVYGPYAKNKREFTIALSSNYQLYTFFWIFTNKVLNKQ
jgi:hypothetical protein